jgi:hypothetical protein
LAGEDRGEEGRREENSEPQEERGEVAAGS